MVDRPSDDVPNSDGPDEDQTVQGHVRHSQLSARVPPQVGNGVFSNGVMILTGPFELVLDFIIRMGEQQRIAARVVLPPLVGSQFVHALRDNIQNYERRFGPIAPIPRPLLEQGPEESPHEVSDEMNPEGSAPGASAAGHPENAPPPPQSPPQIEDIYDELKLSDSMLSGSYANAVLIRHSPTEFCFDFITNVFPRSAVSARVFLAVPHVIPFLKSLTRSLNPPSGPNPGPGPAEDLN